MEWWILLLIITGSVCCIPAFCLLLSCCCSASSSRGVYPLSGKTCVITGGSSGIGLAIARRFLRDGIAHVTLVGRSKDRLAEAAKALNDDTRVSVFSADVTDPSIISSGLFATPFDIAVLSAGASLPARFLDQPLEEHEFLWRANYMGIVHCLKGLLPGMLRKTSPRGPCGTGCAVVVVSSLAGIVSVPGMTSYSASKFAVRGLLEGLAMELSWSGIVFTTVWPPDTDTPMYVEENKRKPRETALCSGDGGLFQAEDIAKGVSRALRVGSPNVLTGTEGWLAGMVALTGPANGDTSVCNILFQACFGGISRLVSLWYNSSWLRIIATVHRSETGIPGSRIATYGAASVQSDGTRRALAEA